METLKTNLGKSATTFLSLLLLGMLSFSVIGCSKDDDQDDDHGSTTVMYMVVLDNTYAYNAQFSEIIYNDKDGLVTTDKAGFGFETGGKTGSKTVKVSKPFNSSLKVKVYNPLNGYTAQMTLQISVDGEVVKNYTLNVGSKETKEYTLTHSLQ